MRRSWRCMAALLLMIMILVSGGCQNIRHLSVSQSEKDDADTGTGYNIYYINNDETKIKAFAYQLSSTTEDGIISECMKRLPCHRMIRIIKRLLLHLSKCSNINTTRTAEH